MEIKAVVESLQPATRSDGLSYLAHCPGVKDLAAFGKTKQAAIDNLQQLLPALLGRDPHILGPDSEVVEFDV